MSGLDWHGPVLEDNNYCFPKKFGLFEDSIGGLIKPVSTTLTAYSSSVSIQPL